MNRTTLTLLGGIAATVISCGLPAAAAPFTITSGSSVSLDFNGFYSSSNIVIPGLSGVVTLSGFSFAAATVGGQQATKVSMTYNIANDSAFPILSSRISNFAMDTTPTLLNTYLISGDRSLRRGDGENSLDKLASIG